ncbi:DUF2147 domain-containing protein [Chitinophaga barathri]|uniref:DUF2147 domain-containing protein n=1 Tax=Chitinophaga barathri TaxID=1647451 RepID=A0A3N4MTP1_9BACT|nr:DUF2147 domain-containing protein [Chitinophaga barathri]RPD42899.1 DUF2147 domain-containing protein [Chitinophaga barathri]
MKNILLAALLLLMIPVYAKAQSADAIVGLWLNEEKDAKIQIYRTGDKYYGKIVWIANAYEADGKTPRKDSKNADASLRNRSIINMVILTDFEYDDGEWEDGKIYDPKSGKTYSSKIKHKGNTLDIRGYVGISMFGRTTVWTKAQ